MNNSVVHKGSPVSEQEFHRALTEGLYRARRKFQHTKEFAKSLGLTAPALTKIYNGGLTSPKRLFDALSIDESVLDDIAALYGRKLVPADSCHERSAAPPVVAALHKIIEAEADGVKKDSELLAMESELRAAEKSIGGLLCRITEIRKMRERVAA